MAQEKIENIRTPLPQRTSPIMDEVLESCILQITHGDRRPEPVANFEVYHVDQIRTWADAGMSQTVAAAILLKEIPDDEAKKILATALKNNAEYLTTQPMYPRMKKQLDSQIEQMKRYAFRLHSE